MKFWIENPKIILDDYSSIIPTGNMDRIQQLNAISRLCLYYIILASLFVENKNYIAIPLFVLIITIIIYYIHKYDKNNTGSYKTKYMSNSDDDNYDDKNNVSVGYYDSDNKIVFPKHQSSTGFKYNANELLEYNKNMCRKPTRDNPFMNPTIDDLGTEYNVEACNVDDDDIKESIQQKFNTDLYRDINDLFDIKNSQRTWYAVPVRGIPNDQPGFANWLYGDVGTCKTDQTKCMQYDDLRFRR